MDFSALIPQFENAGCTVTEFVPFSALTTFKIGGRDYDAFAKMCDKLKRLCAEYDICMTFAASCEKEDLPERIHKYIVER